jgi:glycosyltransferase involved in cell wall biosynthesis
LSWIHFEINLFILNKSRLTKPDVIIVSSLSLLTILNGILLKKKYKCKLVFEIRDIWPLTLVEEGSFSSKNIFIKILSLIEKLGYVKSDFIVGTMPNLKSHVCKVLGYERPVHCIPMGINENVQISKKSLPNYFVNNYLNPNYFNVVYAGTIGITNALVTFFETAELLLSDNSIRFVVVGDGPLKKHYQTEYKHLKNLLFAPKVESNQVSFVLEYSDLVYFSTFKSRVWDYGQSLNKVIDYMSSGRPIVASYSGYPSMINEADCGFFVPAEDPKALSKKIVEIKMMSAPERNALGKRGKDWLYKNRRYSILASKYLDIISGDN